MNCIIVDDDLVILNATEKILRECSSVSDVKSFTSPQSAIEYAETGAAVDLALLDIEIGDINGLELAKALRELSPNIFIIFATSYADYAVDAFGIHASGYIIKPITKEKMENELENIKFITPSRFRKRIYAHTFGTFDLFVDNKPVRFSSAKAKELLAYFIDRRGAAVTSEQAISILWEDRPNDSKTGSLLRMVMTNLRKTLKEVNALDILEEGRNSKRINPELISCDYYSFMAGDDHAIRQYMGEYMQQYSWADITAATLDMEKQIYAD